MKNFFIIISMFTFVLQSNLISMELTKKKKLDRQLIEATNDGDVTQIKNLLDQGANIDAEDEKGRSPLIIAADRSDKEVIKFLLDKGAYVNFQDYKGNSALIHIVEDFDEPELVELLLDKGANPNLVNIDKKTAYEIAVKERNMHSANLIKKYMDK